MKRTISLILAVILLLSLLLTIVPAAYACDNHHGRKAEACAFVDANEDGVCDNCDKSCQKTYADADRDGVCDHCGKDCKTHMHDENKDGICDNCGKTRHAENACAQPKHMGRGHHRNGRHHK